MPSDDLKTALRLIASIDVERLVAAQADYGDSWRKYGGYSAFFNCARKWDRLVVQAERHQFDLFKAIFADSRPEGIIDDVRDLRRYLLLVEEFVSREYVVEQKPIAPLDSGFSKKRIGPPPEHCEDCDAELKGSNLCLRCGFVNGVLRDDECTGVTETVDPRDHL